MGAKGTRLPTTWMNASAGQAKVVGFASVLTMDQDATSKEKKAPH